VEKTSFTFCLETRFGKHLHIRGENRPPYGSAIIKIETSPHTWRKRASIGKIRAVRRNISTYVEKTSDLSAGGCS